MAAAPDDSPSPAAALPSMERTTPPPLPEEYRKGPEYYEPLGVSFSEGAWHNSRGVRLQTTQWQPKGRDPKGLVFLCHGYGVDCSTYFHDTAEAIARGGYAVHGLDYEGFGQSDGLRGFIRSVHDCVRDCMDYYGPIRDAPEHTALPKFLCGESMGGAVVLQMHLNEPRAWRGAVLLAPMCKISESFKPSFLVQALLIRLAWVFPTWALVPTADLSEKANEDPAKRPYFRGHPMIYHGRPRLSTAVACLNISEEVNAKLDQVSLPFLLLHGDADAVTDPAISQALYDRSPSEDKTFKLYPGMWHSLVQGATRHNAQIVLGDVVAWLDKRPS